MCKLNLVKVQCFKVYIYIFFKYIAIYFSYIYTKKCAKAIIFYINLVA